MSSFDYCSKCGKLIDMYNPKHDCVKPHSPNDKDAKAREVREKIIERDYELLKALNTGSKKKRKR